MADTSDFRTGLIIKFKNDLYSIVDFQHVKPGKGGAFVRSTLKNLRTGRVLENTFRAGEKVVDAQHLVTLIQQAVAKMRAEKARASRD